MAADLNRRSFMKQSLAASAASAMAASAAQGSAASDFTVTVAPNSRATMPAGKIGDLTISRMLLGGNLLTHYTHSRDLKYVYNLTAAYNTEEKIHETMALAEAHGINTLSIHNPPGIVPMLKRYRQRHGGKIWAEAKVGTGATLYFTLRTGARRRRKGR